MLINGKEYGLFYDVEAHCEYEDFIIKNPEVGKATATIELAIIMNREFNKENGSDLISIGAIHYEPFGIYAGRTKNLADLPEDVRAEERADEKPRAWAVNT